MFGGGGETIIPELYLNEDPESAELSPSGSARKSSRFKGTAMTPLDTGADASTSELLDTKKREIRLLPGTKRKSAC